MENKIVLSKDKGIRFICDDDTLSGLKKIANLVRNDIKLVLGFEPELLESGVSGIDSNADTVSVVFGIAGKNNIIDKLSDAGIIDTREILGKREVYGFFPMNYNGKDMLVIAGSDKRGTIYGLFHLSELMGVSPLVNWSDVRPAKMDEFI